MYSVSKWEELIDQQSKEAQRIAKRAAATFISTTVNAVESARDVLAYMNGSISIRADQNPMEVIVNDRNRLVLVSRALEQMTSMTYRESVSAIVIASTFESQEAFHSWLSHVVLPSNIHTSASPLAELYDAFWFPKTLTLRNQVAGVADIESEAVSAIDSIERLVALHRQDVAQRMKIEEMLGMVFSRMNAIFVHHSWDIQDSMLYANCVWCGLSDRPVMMTSVPVRVGNETIPAPCCARCLAENKHIEQEPNHAGLALVYYYHSQELWEQFIIAQNSIEE